MFEAQQHLESLSRNSKQSATDQRKADARYHLSATKDDLMRLTYPWIWSFRCAVASHTLSEYKHMMNSHPVDVARWYIRSRTN